MQKAAMFIDGANFYATCKASGVDADYRRLHKYFSTKYWLLRSFYYTAVIPERENEDNYRSIQPLLDWLSYNGWLLVTKDAKSFTNDRTGITKTKGNMDIELAIDAVEIAKHIDVMILLSGDGDFRRLVEHVQRKGVYVICVSSINPPLCADELRRQVDEYIELRDISRHIDKG